MEVYIGGFAQGKYEYVMKRMKEEGRTVAAVVDGDGCGRLDREKREWLLSQQNWIVFRHFHLWIRRLLKEDADVEEQVRQLFSGCDRLCIISDEVGNGIVPMQKEERIYRELVGRMLILAAAKAERVDRITCGIGQTIKGGDPL